MKKLAIAFAMVTSLNVSAAPAVSVSIDLGYGDTVEDAIIAWDVVHKLTMRCGRIDAFKTIRGGFDMKCNDIHVIAKLDYNGYWRLFAQ